MQIKQFLLLVLIALLCLPASPASAQCVTDVTYEASFEANRGSISVEFQHSATGVVVEIIDLLNSKKGVFDQKRLGRVGNSRKYELFGKLKKSIYLLIITAEGCEQSKYSTQVVNVGMSEDDD